MVDKINFISYNRYNAANNRDKVRQLLRKSEGSNKREENSVNAAGKDNASGKPAKIFKTTHWKIKFEKE
jgi:hypothetical protein